jgi:hypothetical protein
MYFLGAQRPWVGRIVSLFRFKEVRHPEAPEFSQTRATDFVRTTPKGLDFPIKKPRAAE